MDISNVINDDGFDCRDVLLLLDKVQGNKIFWQDVFDSFMSFMRKLNQKLVTVKYILVFHYGLFVCLGFSVPLENLSLIWRRHQILTYAQQSLPLNSEGS